MTSAIQAEAARPRSAKKEKKPSSGKLQRNLEILVLAAPAIIVFVGFVILPLILGFYYGFYRWKGFGMPSETGEFAGIDNYITAFKDPTFQAAIGHTFIVVVGSLVIQAPIAILFALLLNQKFKGRGLVRTLIFVPYVISEVIVGTGWSLLLQKTGAVNELLSYIGIDGPDWLADPKIAMITLLVIISWKYIGFAVILMLAGMQSIPEELYEAAKVDGAGFWQMQWSITLPLLAPHPAHLGVPLDDRLAAAVRSGQHHLGQLHLRDRRRLDDGDLHGAQRPRFRQLRLRFGRGDHHLHHLPGRGARLPEVRAQPRSGGSSDRTEAGQEARGQARQGSAAAGCKRGEVRWPRTRNTPRLTATASHRRPRGATRWSTCCR